MVEQLLAQYVGPNLGPFTAVVVILVGAVAGFMWFLAKVLD
jgi:hypothetical protein